MSKYGYISLDMLYEYAMNTVDKTVSPNEFMRMPRANVIPIEVFYKMIHNALADTKKENWEPEECPYDYFDGNRNAIHCMLDILYGDKDGDHDKFWEDYSQWEKENE